MVTMMSTIPEPKHYTREKLTEYVTAEIDSLKRQREDPANWKQNPEYLSQIRVRSVDEEES